MINRVISLGVLALLFGAKAFAQEWIYSVDYDPINDDTVTTLRDVWQKPDNGCIMAQIISWEPALTFSVHPMLISLSPNGTELARRIYYKPSFAAHWPWIVFNDQDEPFALMAYHPDYDSTTANYFHNFDNPPDYAILGLYKLNDNLDIVESHEMQIPVDTFPSSYHPGCYSGQLQIISAESDGQNIVGAYVKSPTWELNHPRGHDTIYFFRMDFKGTFINRVAYEMESNGERMTSNFLYYQIVKVDGGYVFYYNDVPRIYYSMGDGETKLGTPGTAYFMDEEFNILEEKTFHQQPGVYEGDHFQQFSVVRSRHNSVYGTSQYRKPNGYGIQGIGLYEYGDDTGKNGVLPLLRYTERSSGTNTWDKAAIMKGIDSGPDDSFYFTYVLRPYADILCIERLDPNFDTIRTWMYEGDGSGITPKYELIAIKATDDNGLCVLFNSWEYGASACKHNVLKLPAEAFVGIEEAHANGLKVAIAYPNPGKDVLNIFTALRNARVEIYDMAGRLMHRQEITEEVTPIDTEAWPTGTYVWKVFANNSVAETGKWVKE